MSRNGRRVRKRNIKIRNQRKEIKQLGDALRAENARLREALEEAINCSPGAFWVPGARKVLEGK